MAYFDRALEHFFASAEKLPWYKDTLFLITGDHIGPPLTMSPRMIDSYRVPMVFFSPNSAVRCEIFRPKEKEIVICGVEQSEIVKVSPISTAAQLKSQGTSC